MATNISSDRPICTVRSDITLNALLASKELKFVEMLQDRYCFLSAVKEVLWADASRKLNMATIKDLVKSEVLKHKNDYEVYNVSESKQDLTHQLNRYLDHGIYNSSFEGIVIAAVGNALQVHVTIFEDKAGFISDINHPPFRTKTRSTVNFLHHGKRSNMSSVEHYDALVHIQTTEDNHPKQEKQFQIEKRKKTASQLLISDMFSKKICPVTEVSQESVSSESSEAGSTKHSSLSSVTSVANESVSKAAASKS